MPQGVWHQVHSLEAHNVSVNLLFATHRSEKGAPPPGGGRPGVPPPPMAGGVAAPRRPAVLSELAKSVEAVVASAVGPARMLDAVSSVGSAPGKGGEMEHEARVISELLRTCLDADGLPSVEQFVRDYFDPRRFEGLPLRA